MAYQIKRVRNDGEILLPSGVIYDAIVSEEDGDLETFVCVLSNVMIIPLYA